MSTAPIQLTLVREPTFAAVADRLTSAQVAALTLQGFRAERGQVGLVPDESGARPAAVLVGLGSGEADFALALGLPDRLPPGEYELADDPSAALAHTLALGFAIGRYRFNRYRKADAPGAYLRAPASVDAAWIDALCSADRLARDLINTPAQDMGPAQLSEAVRGVAQLYGARFEEIVGDDLLTAGYPAIHAVGRAGASPGRLLRLSGGESGPLIALVGKGVCFDSGGLNLKPGSGMGLMKKDMGGAAVALALASLILAARWPVRLLLLVPAVENGIGPTAFRPGDVLSTRNGLTVEVTNTDAEGRLVLADALTAAVEAGPDLILDFATLTGAARVALGPDVPAVYGNDESLTNALVAAASAEADPLWAMPLWTGYDDELTSRIADLANASSSGFAGSITAALFLNKFVPSEIPWIHLDIYAWNPRERPGRPLGAHPHGLRSSFEWLKTRYAPHCRTD